MDGEESSRSDSRGCLRRFFLISFLVLTVSCCFVFSYVLALGYMYDTDIDGYSRYIMDLLDISGGNWYQLPLDVEEDLIEMGFDPMIVASEVKANEWINSEGGEIDIGMQLSILEFESGGGSNIGSCSGLQSAASFSSQEYESALRLLDYWRSQEIRNWSENARYAVNSDYSDYIGHCSAGEIGPNAILPSTGVYICENGLSHSSDSLVKSCNYFDYRVAPYAKVWWLKEIGYKSTQSFEEKMASLYGWNQSEEYRMQYISRADEINAAIEGIDFNPIPGDAYVFSGGWFKTAAIKLLQGLGLLPKEVYAYTPPWDEEDPPIVVGGFANPYPNSELCGYSYGQPVYNGIHWGIDLCNNWASNPIYAAHSGTVTFARYLPQTEYLAYLWWISGNVVVIEGEDTDGNTIWTAYGHGDNGTMTVREGDVVEAGQFLMMSGNTGFSNGIHLHLGMKVNGSWVNPAKYLGFWGD